jgi:hypothetical protein
MTMGIVSVTWVAMVFLQTGDPTYVDPDKTASPAGPVHRKADDPVPSPAPTQMNTRPQAETPVEEARSVEQPGAALAPAIGTVRVRNEMGKRYRLVEMTVALDGEQVGYRRAPDGTELEKDVEAFQGPVTPGRHAVTVILVYEGRNSGLFNYMDDYKFRVQSGYAFDAAADRPASIDVVARERKGVTVPVEQKLTLEITPVAGSGATAVPAWNANSLRP